MKRKIVFLDRDGIINRDRGTYTWKREDFEELPGVDAFLNACNDQGFSIVIITNQAGIARGLYTIQDVQALMDEWVKEKRKQGVELLDYYFSPHFTEVGNSLDRKPGSLMIEKALARFDGDLKQSLMIGDNQKDQDAAEGAGIRGYVIPANGDLSEQIHLLSGA